MKIRTQAAIGGAAIAAALTFIAIRNGGSSSGGGYYDERGHYVVPIDPELGKALTRPSRAHPREDAILDFVEKKRTSLSTLSPGCRAVWTTFWVEAEVNNGGFDQYFLNTDGAYAKDALEGFRALGNSSYVSLMEQAIAIHQAQKKRDGRNPRYDPLDDLFYKLDEKEPLDALRARYIDAHPDEFPK